MTILKISFLSISVISIFSLVNILNLSTCSRDFWNILQLYSTSGKNVKDADWDIILTWPSSSDSKGIKSSNKDVYIEATNIKNTCTRDIYTNIGTDTRNTSYIGDNNIKSIFIRGTCAKSAYIGSANAIKYLGIHLYSFWVLNIGVTRLNIQIRNSWWLLYLLRILY